MPRLRLIAILCACCWPAIVAAQATPPAAAGAPRVTAVTYRGSASKIESPRYERITAQDEFAKLWKEHLGQRDEHRHVDMLDVDWSTHMVVAIFQGKSFNSNGVKVEEIVDRPEGLLLRFDEWTYQTMSIKGDPEGGAHRVTAFGFIILPRSEKPLVIEENTQGLIGKPPIWTERARMPALKAAGPAPKDRSDAEPIDPRILARLSAVAAEYKSYRLADQSSHWAPTNCRAPSAQARQSASTDAGTHGRKIYFLYAKDLPAYERCAEAASPVGQVIVKEAWTPHEQKPGERVDGLPGVAAYPFASAATIDDRRYVADEPAGLFVMYKGDQDGVPGDAGWVYGVVAADGKQVLAGGRIESCMKCHQSQTHDRLFGPPKDYDRTVRAAR